MSLSQKTREVDTIIVETLFNRGVPLSTSQTYLPVVNYLGTYVPPPTYTVEEQRLVSITTTLVVNVTTLAGGGGGKLFGYSNAIGTNAKFNFPYGVALDALGNIYVADTFNHLIRKITPLGEVTTVAGGGGGTEFGYSNAIGTSAKFSGPYDIAIDALGNIYVADTGNNLIRKITPNSNVTTVAGGGGGITPGYSNAIGTNAKFGIPRGVAVDALGNIYVADTFNHLIRKITSDSNVTTVAGGGGGITSGYSNAIGTNAKFNSPYDIAIDILGNIYVADTGNSLIRKITSDSNVTTVAGGGGGNLSGYSNAIGTNAKFNSPYNIAIDNLGNIYVADTGNSLIRKITSDSNVTTVAGGGGGTNAGYFNAIGTNAKFSGPSRLAVDTLGYLYVSDSGNGLIRKIDTNYPIYTSNYQTVTVNCNITVSQDPTCPCCAWTSPMRGNMLTWSYLSISTIYDSYFYGYNPANLLNKVNSLENENTSVTTSLQLCLDTISTLSNTTLKTFATMCNMNGSTISSYSLSLYSDSISSIQFYNTIKNTYTYTSSITGNLIDTFFMGIFASNTITLQQIGNFYYLPRPIPRPVPVPWYWQGNPPRYIGPGLSSIYTSTLSNIPLLDSYWVILSNTSTSWSASNVIIQTSLQSYATFTTALINGIDTASSISYVFYNSNSSFINHLSTSFYGNDVSTISSFVGSTYIVPTNGPYISTGASSMYAMNSTLNSTLLSYISSGTLGVPLSTFSTIVEFELTALVTDLILQQNIETLSTLNSNYSTFLVPVADLLSLSTNVAGYQSLSTLYPTTFSSVSTFYGSTVPYYLTSNILYNASTLLSTTLGISSYVDWQRSSLLGLNSQYNAAPGASSLRLYHSTNISTSYITYSLQVSSLSTLLQLSTAVFKNQMEIATAYYSNIKPMLNYSTTRYIYPGINTSQYLLRSTYFTAIELRSTMNISSLSVSSLGIAANTNAAFVTKGAANILQVYPTQPSLMLSNFNIYASDTIGPVPGHSIISQLSSIVFNSTFAIKHLYNSTLTGLIGINTLTPEYALDIGAGDARKLTGTTWLNPSDMRIKENIVDAICSQEISSLRLVTYTWSENYRLAHDLISTTTIGFLSQEVETIFPKAVRTTKEEGYTDFRSLDTDQIMKAKFGLTRHLIQRYSTLESRIINLM